MIHVSEAFFLVDLQTVKVIYGLWMTSWLVFLVLIFLFKDRECIILSLYSTVLEQLLPNLSCWIVALLFLRQDIWPINVIYDCKLIRPLVNTANIQVQFQGTSTVECMVFTYNVQLVSCQIWVLCLVFLILINFS